MRFEFFCKDTQTRRGALNPKLCNKTLSNIYLTAMRPIQLQSTCGNSESWNF
jgi:hypothetical protein